MKPKILNAPGVIYLNVRDLDADTDYGDLYSTDLTWCEEKIGEFDLEYRLVKRRRRAVQPSEHREPK